MTNYRISGIWKDANGVITHYAMHQESGGSYTRAVKISKAQAIIIVDNPLNSVYTWLWDYDIHYWIRGGKVQVILGLHGKFLRTIHDKTVKDNLEHLINYNWITP